MLLHESQNATADGIDGADVFSLIPGGHDDYNWAFTEPGTYVFGGKFAAGNKGAKISVTFSPDAVIGPVEIPTTAGFQPGVEVYHVWENLDHLGEVKLPAETFVMTVKIESPVSGMNFDHFTLTRKP